MKKEGFSLIELLVVITILAILAVIGMTVFGSVTRNARDAKRKADVEAIVKALENQFDPETGKYPNTLEDEFFTAKEPPKTPEGGDYDISRTGTEDNYTGFKVCAVLENPVNGSTDYCKQSSQGKFVAAEEPPPADNPLIPPVPPPPPPRTHYTVFLTSTTYDGKLNGLDGNGLDGADSKCQARAQAAGLSGTFKAWISDETGNASNRFLHSTLPYKMVDGTVIANNWSDLTDGNLLAAIQKDEFGQSASNYEAWTGTNSGGTLYIRLPWNVSYTCSNWTSNAQYGIMGLTGINSYPNQAVTDQRWTEYQPDYCNYPQSLYCFEQ